jgi:hypothetical protein
MTLLGNFVQQPSLRAISALAICPFVLRYFNLYGIITVISSTTEEMPVPFFYRESEWDVLFYRSSFENE